MALDRGLGYWLTRRAALTPRRSALVFGGEGWDYAEFNRRSNRLAHALRALGVNHGDRVAYLDLNHPDFFLTLFATAKLGAIFVPLNFRLTPPELAFIIGDAGVHTLIHDEAFAPAVDAIRDRLPCRELVCRTGREGVRQLDDLLRDQRDDDLDNQVDVDEVAVIMYTSGTTGRPKGAMLTHANLLWNNINAGLAFDISVDDTTLVCAPLFHIGGLNVTPLIAFMKGAEVVLMRAFEPGAVLELIPRHRVTTMFGVPAMFLFMSQHPAFAGTDLSTIRFLLCGGAPVPEALIRLYGERGLCFAQGYGLTETAPFVTLVPVDRALDKVGSAGLPPFFTDVILVDDSGREVATGERGEVVVRGPNVMKGYWNRPEATAEAMRDGWFHTGDVATRDEEGYFYIVDRKKDMIISGGENVYPAEVEDCLYQHPAIAEVAVIGCPDERWGETVLAIVVLKPEVEASEQDILDHTQGRLARYKQPRRVMFTEVLPRNPAGKVLKFELRERFVPAAAEQGAPAAR
ncbi:MAG TPA: long-chain fatty acid--CoA ligase [Candidatus Dormibacteraeota bacterium]|nr:long-chain fatty acid--CoA ligase [Candidatus Dormibacteraeota bacterium]